MRKMAAVTLIEILLGLALFGVIVGISLPVSQQFLGRNDLTTTRLIITQTIRTAEANARSGNLDSPWGVKIATGSIIMFKGDSFATRDAGNDLQLSLPTSVSTSGLEEIVFSRLEALPSATGVITISGNEGSRQIALNSRGNLTY